MHHAHRLLVALFVGAMLVLAPAATASPADETPFLVVEDPADDLTDTLGATVNVPDARGLDVARVRQRVVKGRLVLVSKHRNLTRANTNLDPNKVAVGGSLTVLAAYLEPKPMAAADGYTLYFDARRKLTIIDFKDQSAPVPCPAAAKMSRINLDTDRVRYIVPLTCIDGIRATQSTAQVIRYKVTGRNAAGIEQIEIAALDQNDQATPRLVLR